MRQQRRQRQRQRQQPQQQIKPAAVTPHTGRACDPSYRKGLIQEGPAAVTQLDICIYIYIYVCMHVFIYVFTH